MSSSALCNRIATFCFGKRSRSAAIIGLSFLILSALAPIAPAQAAANDNFANAAAVTGESGSVDSDNIDATNEVGEPTYHMISPEGDPSVGATVWYKWSAPAGIGLEVFTIRGPDIRRGEGGVQMAAYTGTGLTTLTHHSNDASSRNGVASLRLTSPTGGVTYYIAIDSRKNNGTDNTTYKYFTLSWYNASSLGNDNFADAATLPGAVGSVSTNNIGATSETGEPVDHMRDRRGGSTEGATV